MPSHGATLSVQAEHLASTGDEVAGEADARRTFAIISHPDAGKTTLTEKFLLIYSLHRQLRA